MQPTYLSWIGYFDLIDQSDLFVFLDDVQLVKRSWGVRNRIKSPQGELFLTVPVKKTNSRDDTFYSNAVINYDEKWQQKHLRSIEMNYRKALNFDDTYQIIEKLLSARHETISDLNISVIIKISEVLGINAKFLKSSSFDNNQGVKDEKLVKICQSINADEYLSAFGSHEYIENTNPGGQFSLNKINLFYHYYKHPEYNQLFNDFIPYLSILDLLFNYKYPECLNIIRSGRKDKIFYTDIENIQ